MTNPKIERGTILKTISITPEENQFLHQNLISPTQLFKWALTQKGYKPTTNTKPRKRAL